MIDIQPFYDALNDLPALARQIKKEKKIIGYLCSYVPEELIMAAGFHPMRLFSSNPVIQMADKHLQSYCCSPVRGLLEDALTGRLNFLDGTVFPHACDTIQRLSDIWRLNTSYPFFTDLIWPVKLNTDSSRTYVIEILKRFKKELETISNSPINNNQLKEAVSISNQIREHIHTIYTFMSSAPGTITAQDLYTMIRASMVMDRSEVAARLSNIVKALLQHSNPDKTTDLKRVVVSGALCDFPTLTQTIESAGACIVSDDFCTGQRWFDGQIDINNDLLTAIAERYIQRMSCPAKHRSLTERQENLVSLVRNNHADGVIFLLTKFCDPHAFDYPTLTTALEDHQIKSILIETEESSQPSGQVVTRLETFIQML